MLGKEEEPLDLLLIVSYKVKHNLLCGLAILPLSMYPYR